MTYINFYVYHYNNTLLTKKTICQTCNRSLLLITGNLRQAVTPPAPMDDIERILLEDLFLGGADLLGFPTL